jgi:predicted dehydrogenase
VRKAREIVQSGVIGSVVAVVGTALFAKPDDYFRRAAGGGASAAADRSCST